MDEGGLFGGIRYGGAAHLGRVGDGRCGVIAEVGKDGASQHAGPADAGVAVQSDMLAVMNAGGDVFSEGGEGFGLWQVHVADRVVEEFDAVLDANGCLFLQADLGGFLGFQQGDERGDTSGAGCSDVVI